MTRGRKALPKHSPLPVGNPEPLKEWVDRLAKDPELAERFVTRWQSAMERFHLDLFNVDPPPPLPPDCSPSQTKMIESEDRRFRTRREKDGFSFLESAPLLVAWCDRHPRIQVDPSPILRLATIAPLLWTPADSVIAIGAARGRRPQATWYRVDADDPELEQVFAGAECVLERLLIDLAIETGNPYELKRPLSDLDRQIKAVVDSTPGSQFGGHREKAGPTADRRGRSTAFRSRNAPPS